MTNPISHAAQIIQQGGVIIYPTEGVFGLGCDPFNREAVLRVLKIKSRSVDKGLILIASCWEQIADLTEPVDHEKLLTALASWPGSNTWIFPASAKVPEWIRGKFTTVALRVSAHPVCRKLCEALNGPLVSTSLNREGQTPAKNPDLFSNEVDFIVPGELGGAEKPSKIRDVLTGKVLRL